TDVVVRTSDDPRHLVSAIQAEARRRDPQAVVDRPSTMDAIVGRAFAPWQFSVWILTVFAGLACTLAAVGLFSLVSLDVAQRRHEFAVRLALGAHRADIVRPVVWVAATRSLLGLALGVVTAIAAMRGIQSLLFGVASTDLATYGAAIALLLTAVALASSLPAWRASRIDPAIVLREA
ncbi:MAG: permease, partial [Acidobacteria bacterium]